ncbi:MAG: haloacid dehalogenase-like hydrolase [Atopobiaceae bacterium]|nr:haloacid dehalogenase-like hydrolase [Atopobiaceae bacterium]
MGRNTVSHRTPLAVFDLDGTLIDGQSGSLISIYLLAHKVVSLPRAARLAWWGARYKLHLPQRQDEPREVILAALNQRTPEEIRQTMRGFHDEVMIERYRPKGVAEVRQRASEGCVTLLASATFRDVAERAAEHLGMDGFVATEMERDASGDYTGRVEGDVTEGKAKLDAVIRWANDRFGADGWYVKYAYGDHGSDAPLLSIARHPFAVEPSYLMKLIAKQRKWTILKWGTSS